MSEYKSRFLEEGCVAKENNLICRLTICPDGRGLVCEKHLEALRQGKVVGHRASLNAEERRCWKSLKPQGGAEAKTWKAEPVTLALASGPGLLVLLTPAAVLLFERAWRHELGITIPIGTELFASGSMLTLDIIFALFGVVMAYVFLVAGFCLVLLLLGWLTALVFALIPAGQLLLYGVTFVYLIVKRLLCNGIFAAARALPYEKFHTWSEQSATRLATSLERTRDTRRKSLLDGGWAWMGKVRTGSIRLANLFSNALSVAFGAGPLTRTRLTVRLVCVAAAGALSLWNVQNEARQLNAALETQKECKDLTRTGWFGSGMSALGLSAPGAICGKITFAQRHSMQATRLRDAAMQLDLLISKNVYHLGRYGDWVVVAPADDTSARVLLKASQISEFARAAPLPEQEADGPPESGGTQAQLAQAFSQLATLSAGLAETRGEMRDFIQGRPSMGPELLERVKSVQTDTATILQSAVRNELESVDLDLRRLWDAVGNLEAAVATTIPLLAEQADWSRRAPESDEKLLAAAIELQTAARLLQFKGSSSEGDGSGAILRAELESRYGVDVLVACRAGREPISVGFSEGSARVLADGPVEKVRDLIEARGSEDRDRLVLIEGYASATGSSLDNLRLADRRADTVKTRLIEALFETATPLIANEDGPELLSRKRITMVAYGVGEALDGQGSSLPRRVDIYICSG
ncbi:hypothetical protein [Sulfitobacter sp. MF3-043]|uniref:hypothetical protein n=1 Tax=Sulfitobacter sediminivivens TaxID=3252902 RepID=UPI0036D7FE51